MVEVLELCRTIEIHVCKFNSGFILGNYFVENVLPCIQLNVSMMELTYPVHQGCFNFS